MTENSRLNNIADWYLTQESSIDKKFIFQRYKSMSLFFRGSRCLELGPAQGEMTKYIVNDFDDLTLVDASNSLLNNIPDYSNVKKIVSLFEDFDTDIKYDTILLDHVLEHVKDPVNILRRISSWLDKNGILIVGVPNGNSIHRLIGVEMGYLSKNTQLNERDILLGHRRVYTMNSLKSDLITAGLNVEYMGGVTLKVLSNKQIEDSWTPKMVDAFCKLGNVFPNNAGDIFSVCQKGETI